MSQPTVSIGSRSEPLADVGQRAARLATALRERGIRHGDRYAIIMRNDIEFLVATLAAAPLGAVPVPVNWHWTGSDLKHLLVDSGSKVAICHTDFLDAVEAAAPASTTIIEVEVPPEVQEAYGSTIDLPSGRHELLHDVIVAADPIANPSPEPPMSVIYTSGTTGLPKGVLRDPIEPAALPGLVATLGELLGFRPGGTTIIPAPLYHAAPNVSMTFAAAFGMNIHIMARFDAVDFLKAVETHRVTTVQMVPTMFVRLLALDEKVRASFDLSSLEAVVHAAAPCPPSVKRRMIDWLGPIVNEYYGGSEGGTWTNCTSEEWLSHPGTVGRAFGGAELLVLDANGHEVPTGEDGIIYGTGIEGWPKFTYLGQPEKRNAIAHGDFFTIGDVGHLDDDGFLYLSDRLSDMVISGGVNIYPAEIESCLYTLEGVADVAVFGIPDADLGEVLAAHVELAPGANLSEDRVREHVRQHLAGYKAPRVVVFDDALPRDDSGKLFKRRLQALYRPTTEEPNPS